MSMATIIRHRIECSQFDRISVIIRPSNTFESYITGLESAIDEQMADESWEKVNRLLYQD